MTEYNDFLHLNLSRGPEHQRILDELEDETLAAQECVEAAKGYINDAKRYRWLRAHAQSDSLSMDGTAYWRIPSYCILLRAISFDASVDLAMEEEKEKKRMNGGHDAMFDGENITIKNTHE